MLYEVITSRMEPEIKECFLMKFVITSYSIHYTKLYEGMVTLMATVTTMATDMAIIVVITKSKTLSYSMC